MDSSERLPGERGDNTVMSNSSDSLLLNSKTNAGSESFFHLGNVEAITRTRGFLIVSLSIARCCLPYGSSRYETIAQFIQIDKMVIIAKIDPSNHAHVCMAPGKNMNVFHEGGIRQYQSC